MPEPKAWEARRMMKQTIGFMFSVLLSIATSAFAVDINNNVGSIAPAAASVGQIPASDRTLPALDLEKKPAPLLLSQTGPDDLPHAEISSSLDKKKDLFCFVDIGAAIPIYDKHFRDFVDYGAAANLGIAKRVSSDLIITTSIGAVMMTGEWRIRGDRHSIEIAAEEWTPGIISEPGQITVNPEDVPDENLGTGYHASGEAVITSAENLESVDIDTTLYLFPVRIGALYQFSDIGRIKPYAGGGFGFCLAVRRTDSNALKSKYFDGPEYGIKRRKSQSVTGTLLDLVFGFTVPFKNSMYIKGEINTTLYDLDKFDPVLEVSYEKIIDTPFPDITTYSYENPAKIGVFDEVFITNLTLGLIIPF
jgi:hypothetical protein